MPAGGRDVPALQLRLSAFNEDVTVTRLTLRASGTLDDASGVSAVHLFADRNADGRVGPGDTEVTAPARIAADDGAVSFSPLAERVVKNTSAVYLAVLELSGDGQAGQTIALRLDRDADATAFGALSGAVGASGTPIAGPRVTLVGALSVRLGAASPPGAGVAPGASFPALQLELLTQGEAVSIEQLSLRTDGSADDAKDLAEARLVLDADGDGVAGPGDPVLAGATPDGNDGLLTFATLALRIAPDGRARLLVTLRVAQDATLGGTLRLLLEANEHLRARGEHSGTLAPVGAPVMGAAFTIVRGLPKPTEGAPPDAGCSCSTHRSRPKSASAALLLLLALALALARPRRHPSSA